MHSFIELIDRTVTFSLHVLDEKEAEIFEALQLSGATAHIKNLQAMNLNRAFVAVGMFSMFEALIQDRLNCDHGFSEAKECLSSQREADLLNEFKIYCHAINVLKHGRGRSYKALLENADNLPFRIKTEAEDFFDEGDISEVTTLVEVDRAFVIKCADVVQRVSHIVEATHQTQL